MSDLSIVEKKVLEKAFTMGGGYFLDFNDRTFAEFVLEATGKDIDAPAYRQGSGSKANRMRGFWRVEPNHVVAQLVTASSNYAQTLEEPPAGLDECRIIAGRLAASAPVAELAAIMPNADGRDFDLLGRSVRESIERSEPETGLDRLHTFVVRYVRVLAEREGLVAEEGKPLHGMFGELVKALRFRGAIETEMSERILKSSIAALESFNHVRNHRSLAHDNPLLSYHEALLIFNHVAASIKFLSSLPAPGSDPPAKPTDDELAF